MSCTECCPSQSAHTEPIHSGKEFNTSLNAVFKALPFPKFTLCFITFMFNFLISSNMKSHSLLLPSFTTKILLNF